MTTPELLNTLKKNPIVTGCVVLSLGLAVAIYFRGSALSDANAELDMKSAEARRYALNVANAVQLREQLAALKAADQVIDSRMLRASDIGINQQFFYKLESDSGVKLVDLRQGKPGPKKGSYVPIEFSVSLRGDFPNVIKFLRSLEGGTHYCRVLAATCTGGRSGPVALSLRIELLGHP